MDAAGSGSRRGRMLVALGVAVAVVALGIALIASRQDESSDTVEGSVQIASVQQACGLWLDGDDAVDGDASWCSDMSGWMSERMSAGGMGPRMMWGDPDRMRATCEQWMTTAPPAGATADPGAWCDSMVTWMTDHLADWSGRDSWDGWMMRGPMMGG